MRLGPGLLYEGRTLQGARPKLADFCSATMAEFYSAVDIGSAYFAQIWIAGLIALALQTSFLTPPFGYALFFAKMAAPKGINLSDIYRGAVPLVAIEIVLIAALISFPQLITWLPEMSLGDVDAPQLIQR